MLKQLRNLKHTRNFVIIGFIVFMAASLVFFYKPGGSGSSVEPTRNMDVVARVNSDDITVADIAQLTEQYRQMFGEQARQFSDKKRILDGLISARVISQEAARLNLAASKDELKERLFKQFTDPSGKFIYADSSGKVDVKKYQEDINRRYGGVEKFEKGIRDSIEQEKLRAFVTSSVTVSPEEVQNDYKRKFTEFDLTYIAINVDKIAEQMQVADQDLRSYYDQHKDSYKINEPQKKIRYVFIDQDKAGQKLQIPDADLKKEYENLDPEHKQAGVKVQQILMKVARKDLDSQVEQKTKDLITKIRGAKGEATEQSFSDVAKGNSEDPASAKNGGYLARLIKRNPNKPDGLYDRVLDMQPGEVTDVPIRYGGNFYILRRGDSVPKTFEEAKPELLISLRNRRGYTAAAGLAQRAFESLKKSHDAQKVAQELAAEANMSPADMVRETPYIKPGDDVPNIGSNQQFEQSIAALNNPNDVGERTGIKNGFAIPMFVDKKDPRVPEFDEIKDRVAKDYKQAKAKEQLDQKARDIASSVNSAADLKAAAEKAGLEAKLEEAYKEGRSISKLAASPTLDEMIFGMKEGEVSKTPIKIGDNWVIVGITKRREADLAEFAKQRDQLTESALRDRQEQVYGDYVAALVSRLKDEGKIKINQTVLDSIEEEEPQITMPRQSIPLNE